MPIHDTIISNSREDQGHVAPADTLAFSPGKKDQLSSHALVGIGFSDGTTEVSCDES
jgi:hypothetical protein